ncbi:hypothetical protein Tco_0675950, partial [Tanacetum coccineum]
KSSTSKDTSKGNSPPKTSKSDKSVHAEESVVEPTKETDSAPKHDWFRQPQRPPTPDPEWNTCQVVNDHPEQPWFNILSAAKDPLIFDKLMATPLGFSNFAKNHLKLDKITKADLVGPVYNLLKGTCQGSFELEYNMEECFKASNDRIDWENPKGDRCPFDLSKPLPLKGRPGHLTVAAEYFFNNDLEYLKSTDSERKYTTSITKMKATRYELVGIEDMILKQWSVTKVGYNKDAECGIKHWGPKRQLFYRSQLNKFSKHEVFSHQKILSVVSMKVNKLNGYSYLEEIALFHLDGKVIIDLAVALYAEEADPEEFRKIGGCKGT